MPLRAVVLSVDGWETTPKGVNRDGLRGRWLAAKRRGCTNAPLGLSLLARLSSGDSPTGAVDGKEERCATALFALSRS